MYQRIQNSPTADWIIAIPPLGERKELFDPLTQKLSMFNWLLFDLPGSNQQVQATYDIPTLCHLINEQLEEHAIQNAHFIGNSLGAWAIQAFYTLYPNKVSSLFLLDGGHHFLGDLGEEIIEKNLKSGTNDKNALEESLKNFIYSFPNLEKANYESFYNYFIHNYILIDDEYCHHSHPKAYFELSKELSLVDYCLSSFSCPAYLLIAEGSANDYLLQKAKQFKGTEVHYIKNGQHYLPLTNTEEVALYIQMKLRGETICG